MDLSLRVDRIDELETGEHVVIDYKTGLTRLASWFDDRLDEPQLPLYGISEANSKALIIAEIRAQKLAFKGIAANDIGIKNVVAIAQYNDPDSQDSWQQQMHVWRQQLQALAEEFVQGEARVDPKNIQACSYCELSGLCRIQ